MDASQIHLALNHLPLFLPFCGLVILAIALIRKRLLLFHVSLVFFIVAALGTIPVYLSGEGAEHVVEGFAGVSDQFIEPHEEAADYTFMLVVILGVVALAALITTRKFLTYPKSLSIILLVMSATVFAVVARTAHLGGQIRHQELRSGNTLSPAPEDD